MKKKFKLTKLTKEEKDIEKSLDGDQWVEAEIMLKGEIIEAAKHSVSSKKRGARVNIRLMQGTVELIRHKAEEEGLGYQTLMSSVLHKYALGRLVEKNVFDDVISRIASKTQVPKKKTW